MSAHISFISDVHKSYRVEKVLKQYCIVGRYLGVALNGFRSTKIQWRSQR